MNLLEVTPWFPNHPADGQHQHVFRQAHALIETGARLRILVVRPIVPKIFAIFSKQWLRPSIDIDSFKRFELNVSEKHYFSLPRYFIYGYQDFLARVTLIKVFNNLIEQSAFDLVHIHTEQTGFIFKPLCRNKRIPVVITLHAANPNPLLYNSKRKLRRLSRTLDRVDRVVLVGSPLKSFFKSKGCKGDNFTVVPNGYHIPNLGRTERSRKCATDKIRFCSVSHLYESKGVMLNLRALRELANCGLCDWEYHVLGDGPLKKRTEVYARANNMIETVHFHGHLEHPNAMKVLTQCDVLALPSRNEAFGVVYLEAMALGLLVIGIKGQGPSDFIQHMKDCILIDFDAKQLCDTFKDILCERDKFRAIAEEGRRKVITEFTWQRNAARILDVFQTTLVRNHSLD